MSENEESDSLVISVVIERAKTAGSQRFHVPNKEFYQKTAVCYSEKMGDAVRDKKPKR